MLAAVEAGDNRSRASRGLAPVASAASAVPDSAADAESGGLGLRRVFDGPVEYTAPRGVGGPTRVHARVWDGQAEEGRRVVVLIGLMSGHHGGHENSAMAVARQVLDVPAQQVVWLVHHPLVWGSGTVGNPVLIWPGAASGLQAMIRNRDMTPTQFAWGPVTWAEIEALVGERVECYQRVGYTAATIEEWQRRRDTVAVVEDTIGMQWRLGAIDLLDRRVGNEDHRTTAARRMDAVAGATLLAEQLRETLSEVERAPIDDGTRATFGEPSRVWATRRVTPTPNGAESVLLSRYPGPFTAPDTVPDTAGDLPHHAAAEGGPAEPATTWTAPPDSLEGEDLHRFTGMVALLDRLQSWRDDVDDAAFEPDPNLVAALDGVERALGWELWLLRYRARQVHPGGFGRVPAEIPAAPSRSQTRAYAVVGPTDHAFLAGLSRVGPDDTLPEHGPGVPAARRRRLQARLDRDAELYRVDPTRAWFGLDPHGHLVAFAPALDNDRGRPTRNDPGGERGILVAEWPLHPPPEPIPDDAVVVADGAPGDRPVYLQWPSGSLTPWPGGPRRSISTMWNFGPDGGTGLAGDLVEVLAAADLRLSTTLPGDWVSDQLERARPDLLSLRIGDIRSRAVTT